MEPSSSAPCSRGSRKCFNCGGSSHAKSDCPSSEQTEAGRQAFRLYQTWLRDKKPPAQVESNAGAQARSPLTKFLDLLKSLPSQSKHHDPVAVAREVSNRSRGEVLRGTLYFAPRPSFSLPPHFNIKPPQKLKKQMIGTRRSSRISPTPTASSSTPASATLVRSTSPPSAGEERAARPGATL